MMIIINNDLMVSEEFLDRIDMIKKESNDWMVVSWRSEHIFEFTGFSEDDALALMKAVKERKN